MAIQTSPVNTSSTVLYTSSGNSAVTLLSLCNYSAATVTVDIHVVPAAGTAGDGNLFIKGIEIVAGDTFVAYEGGEKLVLGDNDTVVAKASTAAAVSAITSYVNI